MAASVIDQTARDNAREAKLLLSAHEQVCAERQGNIIRRLGKLEKMAWAIIVALLGVLVKGLPVTLQ